MCIGQEIFGCKPNDISDKTSNIDSTGKDQTKDEKDKNLENEVVFDKARFDYYNSGRNSTLPIMLTLNSANGLEQMRITS